MEESHAFIMPGIYDNSRRAETQGLVIQEAQAMELPVLISDVGGMKFGVIDGETGFVLKEKDLNAFVKKVELLIQDENLARAMGKKGREFVIQNYDSKVLGAKLEKLYFESYEGYYEKKNFYKSSQNKGAANFYIPSFQMENFLPRFLPKTRRISARIIRLFCFWMQ